MRRALVDEAVHEDLEDVLRPHADLDDTRTTEPLDRWIVKRSRLTEVIDRPRDLGAGHHQPGPCRSLPPPRICVKQQLNQHHSTLPQATPQPEHPSPFPDHRAG
ncbi:hypothetical protein [Streptomyces atratus]|uniref:hypothetical protein n=1 Tax=Streptomyces atratus TaxID=1893 RepID=UPI00364EC3DD